MSAEPPGMWLGEAADRIRTEMEALEATREHLRLQRELQAVKADKLEAQVQAMQAEADARNSIRDAGILDVDAMRRQLGMDETSRMAKEVFDQAAREHLVRTKRKPKNAQQVLARERSAIRDYERAQITTPDVPF